MNGLPDPRLPMSELPPLDVRRLGATYSLLISWDALRLDEFRGFPWSAQSGLRGALLKFPLFEHRESVLKIQREKLGQPPRAVERLETSDLKPVSKL